MSKTMHVISKGDYSDYRVLAVCKSKKVAKRLAARYNAREASEYYQARVEEIYYVDDPDIKRVETLEITINLWDDGTENEAHQSYRVEWPFDTLFELTECSWRWVRAPIHKGLGGRLEVRGTNHELVLKVYGEKRAMLKSDDAMRAKREMSG